MKTTLAFARPAPAPEPKKQALAEIVRRAASDARTDPERYLRDTRVPGGGE